ncbi:A/G-specific adenine glycosylase [Verrucomicrobia bacterium LW23]|nr:A/G-specific adenine glycosylase [Verrucomicrobia bacterium LW23]
MLQQTQVTTVLPYYDRWLRLFPTWQALAEAPEGAVLKAWEGLGYYRRVRNLQRLAKVVAESPTGRLPETAAGLLELPGIGPYTASAIASIAHNEPTAVLDGNVIRVLTRQLAYGEDVAKPAVQETLRAAAQALLDPETPADFNQAIMELGAVLCTPRGPQCLVCPVRLPCKAAAEGDPLRYPVKERADTTEVHEVVSVMKREGHASSQERALSQGHAMSLTRYLCEEIPPGERNHGLWRFPRFDAETMREEAELCAFTYGITRYRVRLRAVLASPSSLSVCEETEGGQPAGTAPGARWLTAQEIEALPFASAHRKIATLLLERELK